MSIANPGDLYATQLTTKSNIVIIIAVSKIDFNTLQGNLASIQKE